MRSPRLTTPRQFILTSPSAERSDSFAPFWRARAARVATRALDVGAALRADAAAGEAYDLIAVSDVLVYVGDLAPFFAAAAAAARPSAALAITLEDGAGPTYDLAATGRYRHAPAYCAAAARAYGWALVARTEATLRENRGKPVRGSVFLFRRPMCLY